MPENKRDAKRRLETKTDAPQVEQRAAQNQPPEAHAAKQPGLADMDEAGLDAFMEGLEQAGNGLEEELEEEELEEDEVVEEAALDPPSSSSNEGGSGSEVVEMEPYEASSKGSNSSDSFSDVSEAEPEEDEIDGEELSDGDEGAGQSSGAACTSLVKVEGLGGQQASSQQVALKPNSSSFGLRFGLL